jgi:hypothetical protein
MFIPILLFHFPSYYSFLVVYKKDISHFRTIQTRHQQIALNESNKDKNNFKEGLNKKSYSSDIQFKEGLNKKSYSSDIQFKEGLNKKSYPSDIQFKEGLNKKSYPSDIQFELDTYKRPLQKIALLCGSPGAGVCYLISSKNCKDKKSFILLENNTCTCCC